MYLRYHRHSPQRSRRLRHGAAKSWILDPMIGVGNIGEGNMVASAIAPRTWKTTDESDHTRWLFLAHNVVADFASRDDSSVGG